MDKHVSTCKQAVTAICRMFEARQTTSSCLEQRASLAIFINECWDSLLATEVCLASAGSQRSNDLGIEDWSQLPLMRPATTSCPVVTLLGSPSPPSKGKVSERTRSHTLSESQQTSIGKARDSAAAASNPTGA